MNRPSVVLQRLVPLGAILLLAGCLTAKGLSAGKVACPPNEIEITDEQSTMIPLSKTWTASCRGKTYFCSHQSTGENSAQTACTAAEENPPVARGAKE